MTFNATFFWVAVGLVLIIAEMFHMSMVLLFFGIAALLVALAKFLGLNNLSLEIVLFAVTGLGSMLLFRRKMLRSIKTSSDLVNDRNAVIVLSHDVAPHGSTSVTYQGVAWTAINDSDAALKKGDKVYVQRTEGVKLIVRPEPVSN